MHLTLFLLATAAILSAIAPATWLWFALTRLRRELLELGDFRGMHFESHTP